jgi:hypothetical protein
VALSSLGHTKKKKAKKSEMRKNNSLPFSTAHFAFVLATTHSIPPIHHGMVPNASFMHCAQ